jgi:hypothetical protein
MHIRPIYPKGMGEEKGERKQVARWRENRKCKRNASNLFLQIIMQVRERKEGG